MILYLLFVHWVADFLLQSNHMGNLKSRSVKWLSLHVLVYTAALALGLLYFGGPHLGFVYFVLINGGSHWLIDFATSKITTACYKRQWFRLFFDVIGLDQLLHLSILLYSWLYFLPR